MEEYRVISHHSRWRDHGEWNEERKQYLQKKIYRRYTIFGMISKFYWKTIDTEVVPSAIWQMHACLGSTDWKSKFIGTPNCVWDIRTKKN